MQSRYHKNITTHYLNAVMNPHESICEFSNARGINLQLYGISFCNSDGISDFINKIYPLYLEKIKIKIMLDLAYEDFVNHIAEAHFPDHVGEFNMLQKFIAGQMKGGILNSIEKEMKKYMANENHERITTFSQGNLDDVETIYQDADFGLQDIDLKDLEFDLQDIAFDLQNLL